MTFAALACLLTLAAVTPESAPRTERAEAYFHFLLAKRAFVAADYPGALREFRKAAERWYEQAHRPDVVVYPGCSAGRLRERWPEKKWVDFLESTSFNSKALLR